MTNFVFDCTIHKYEIRKHKYTVYKGQHKNPDAVNHMKY